MGKKGSKRKTRWRTLSIGAPPGEEDEEEGLRNGYVKGQENNTSGHNFDRHRQSGYKPRKSVTGSSGTTRSRGYGSSGTEAHCEESTGSPSQPKIIFNEDEYTRITTPRQDVLFKKGYLSRKKPWAGNASTSATPSTTESQSASHSTADGSETTEDQQLLDRDSGTGEYPPMVDSGAQLGYGTFYDHSSGYYYEYPVMLVGPAPVPAQIDPSVLAAVPCGPVPLRPIEWINPAFVPEPARQPYCMMDYQAGHNAENVTLVEEQENTLPPDNTNEACNESGTGSASCNGSVAGEIEEQATEKNAIKEYQTEDQSAEEDHAEEHAMNEQHIEEQSLENGVNGGGPYLEPIMMQQPVHVSHVIPAVPQPYMYPGHYMFGPPLVNVNGVTIQSGPMIRTTDVAAMVAACAKRRKKKKTRKQRRPALNNTEHEEEGDYSSECDSGLPSSRLSWTACPTSTTITTTTANRPLNPECQEFQLRTVVEPHTSLTVIPTSDNTRVSEENVIVDRTSEVSSDATISIERNNEVYNGSALENSEDQDEKLMEESSSDLIVESPLESNQLTSFNINDLDNEENRLTNCLAEKEEPLLTNEITEATRIAKTEDEAPPNTDTNKTENDLSCANETRERLKSELNGIDVSSVVNSECFKQSRANEAQISNSVSSTTISSRPSSPHIDNLSHEILRSRSSTPKPVPTQYHQAQENVDSLSNTKSSAVLPKRKYSTKGLKYTRESTPGPDLDTVTNTDVVECEKIAMCDMSNDVENHNLSISSNLKLDSSTTTENSDKISDDHVLTDSKSDKVCNHRKDEKIINDEIIESSNEDSGFESQTRLSEYPITEAVTEWLRRANSPDVLITSTISSDSETDDDDNLDEKPPKNLQGNPMPALSVNSDADNTMSRTTNCGKFARANNIKIDQVETNSVSLVLKKKKDAKVIKKKSSERIGRRVRHIDGKAENELVSSSDSCNQRDDFINATRKKNLSKQDVGDICEFTEMDSVAGMRVASYSRMDSKRIGARRTKRQGKLNRDLVENIDMKIRCIEDVDNENDEKTAGDEAVSVRTFEKGEIIVSKEGKFLTTASCEPILYTSQNTSAAIETVSENSAIYENAEKAEDSKAYSSGEEENGTGKIPLNSIEEPDVLECWEAETIEPVITPKRMLQSRGILCEGEAAEEDNFETEQVNIDYVQKYYRFARGSATSIEEETSEFNANVNSSTSRTVPNNPEQMIESFCSEETPVVVSDGKQKGIAKDKAIPIDEAFEVYESCYTGKAQFLPIDSKLFKPQTLYGQKGEGPIPCRAVCCNLQ